MSLTFAERKIRLYERCLDMNDICVDLRNLRDKKLFPRMSLIPAERLIMQKNAIIRIKSAPICVICGTKRI